MISIVEHSGFIEPSPGIAKQGFAIRKVATLGLSISKNQKPKNLYLSLFRTNNEWRYSKIEVKINSSQKFTFKLPDTGFKKSKIGLLNILKEDIEKLEFRIYPRGFKKYLHRIFKTISGKRPISLARDSILISELFIDEEKILVYGDKNKFNYLSHGNTNQIQVRILGFFNQTFGLAEASRRTLKAIQTTPIKVSTTQIPYSGKHIGKEKNTLTDNEIPKDKNEIRIFHFNNDHFDRLITDWGKSILHCKYSIGFWHWELPDFPDDNLPWFNKIDEIWVPSRFVFDAIAPKSSKPVQIIPLGLDEKILNPPPPDCKKFGIPNKKVIFLIMFDFYSVIERKNPISGILAFSELVRNKAYGDKVHLVVKISNQHADSTGVKLLLETLDMIDPQKVTLIDQVLTRKGIVQLINSCDSLISLHRSEGFGLHLAEAMAMGKSVLSTNWSGNVDFMDATNSYPINFDIVPLENDAGSYKKGNFWAEVDVEHAVSQMKKVLENEFAGNEVIKQNAKRQIIETHSIKRISSMIENRIKIIEYHLGTIRV